MLFFVITIIIGILEIISTKSFNISIDLPNIHIVFLGVLLFSFMVSFTVMPFYGKPSKEVYTFEDKTKKEYIVNKIDEIISDTSKENNVKKRKRVEVNKNKIIYSSGVKILDYVIQPIIINIHEDAIIVEANIFFIKKINSQIKNKI